MTATTLPSLTLAQACKYLAITSETLTELCHEGFIVRIDHEGRQHYPRPALDVTRKLLALRERQSWSLETIAWYADLVFATEIGRAILLPLIGKGVPPRALPNNWLETPYVSAVAQDIELMLEEDKSPLLSLLRSVVTASVGEQLYWSDAKEIKKCALYPLIVHFEVLNMPIFGQGATIARDAGPIFQSLMHTFITIAPPISAELRNLISNAQTRLNGYSTVHTDTSLDEQAMITRDALVAVDKFYASKLPEIHTQPDEWSVETGIISAERRTISLQLKLPLEAEKDLIDNIIDLIRPYVGNYGARVIHLLYETANDAPYWRNPLITVDTNEMLDRLGLKRDGRGVHYSRNRERLRDVLNVAHNLEIVGEFLSFENGQSVRKAVQQTVLSLIGATFDLDESRDLSTSNLFSRGLPKSMQIRLNFYDGVRHPNGKLGNQYVLMPRLHEPTKLSKANHAATHEMLQAYFLYLYRQLYPQDRVLKITREMALEKAHITNKYAPRATATLRKTLDRLIKEGMLESYSAWLPTVPTEAFEVVLSLAYVLTNLSAGNISKAT